MLSYVRLFDDVKIKQIYDVHSNLREYFSNAQLDEIEHHFEDCCRLSNSPSTQLRAIMKNIIKNRGTFKP